MLCGFVSFLLQTYNRNGLVEQSFPSTLLDNCDILE